MCLLSRDGRSKALLQTLQGRRVLSLGLALGVGPLCSGMSPCELAAELSPDTDFPSSSADGGDPDSARDSSDMERSNGESANKRIHQVIYKIYHQQQVNHFSTWCPHNTVVLCSLRINTHLPEWSPWSVCTEKLSSWRRTTLLVSPEGSTPAAPCQAGWVWLPRKRVHLWLWSPRGSRTGWRSWPLWWISPSCSAWRSWCRCRRSRHSSRICDGSAKRRLFNSTNPQSRARVVNSWNRYVSVRGTT